MSELSQDELTVLMLANRGESMAPIGRWDKPTRDLHSKGLLRALDDFNYVITDKGREVCAQDEDEPFRQVLEIGNQISQTRAQTQQHIEQAAIHLSMAALASKKLTGDSYEQAVTKWLETVKTRALELARHG